MGSIARSAGTVASAAPHDLRNNFIKQTSISKYIKINYTQEARNLCLHSSHAQTSKEGTSGGAMQGGMKQGDAWSGRSLSKYDGIKLETFIDSRFTGPVLVASSP